MPVDRREFLLGAAAAATVSLPAFGGPLSAGSSARTAASLGAGVRADFPRASTQTYLNSAAQHPLGLPMLRAMERHLHFEVHGPGEGREYFSRSDQATLKEEFGR